MATNKDFIVKNGLSVGEDISVSGSVTSNLQFDDNVQLQLGTDSDLLIYHDNSNAYIDDVGAGSLHIRSGTTYFQNAAGTKTSIQTNSGAGQTLYFNNDPIFATLVDGVSVTGNAVLTGELHGPASFVIDPTAVGDNTGEVVIKGDLTVEGTTTTVNSTQLDIADKNITLNVGAGDTSATADQAGITIQDAVSSGNDATILWTTSNDRFNFSHPVAVTGDIIGSGSLQIVRSAAGAASVLLQRNGASGSWSLAQGHTATDYFEILEGSASRMTIANGGATTFPGNLTSNGTITGADFSGITMGGSLTGSHDDAKVQYGNSFSGTPAQGHFFFDALNQKLKVYTGSAFVDAVPAGGGGGGGSGSSDATATFRKYTYTLTGTTNAISGKEDDEVTTGDFISGRLYEITAVGDTDFTAIGASSNAIGVQFTATDVGGGTTGKAKEVLFYATGGTQNIEVYVNGVKAVEGSSNDYVATTGTSVTFTTNLSSGDVVDIQVYELLTNDSYYLKTETYTQAEVNSQITTGTSSYLPLTGGNLTGNLNVGAAGSTALFTAYGGATARPTFVHASGYGGLQLAGTGAGSGASLIFSNNHTNGIIEEWSIFHDGATDDLVFISGDPADVATHEKMRLTDTGYLALGLTATQPTSQLTVGGNSITTASPTAFFTDMTNGGSIGIRGRSPTIAFDKTGSNASARILLDGGALQFRDGDLDETLPDNSGATSDLLMVLSHDGKLGIGNVFNSVNAPYYVDPSHKLDVDGDINARGTFRTDQAGVNLRPSLLLDFANSKSLDPTVTYTRSSTARYYDGYTTAKAGENLRKYSEDFTNAYWVPNGAGFTANQTAAPTGETTADKCTITASSGYHDAYTNQEHTNAGEYHTHSVYVKQGTGIPSVYIYTNVGSGGSIAKFNITNGTYIGNASGNGYNAFASHSVQDVGGGWYRISATYLETSSTYRPFTLGFSDTTADTVTVITGNGTDHFFVWGSQVERSNGPTEYVKTTASPKYTSVPKLLEAPVNAPRFDHDPYTGESKGFLIESARTNLLTESIVKSSYWYTPASLFDENSGVAPDGTLTATTVYSNGASNVHKVVPANAGQYYTVSVYAKKSDAGADTTMGVYLYASGTTNDFIQHTTFNLVTGQIANANVGSQSTNGAFSRIYPVGNGWYRLSVTGVMPAGISQNISSGIMYTPSQPNAAFLLWGAQLENSEFHTSYIPTSGSTVSRTQDNAKIENIGTSSWYSKGKGSTYVEAAAGGYTTSQGFMSLYQTGYGNDWHGYYANSPSTSNNAAYTVNGYNVRYGTSVGGGNSTAVGNSSYPVGQFVKGAQAWDSEGMSYAFDGLSTSATGDRYVTEHNTLNFSQLYEAGFHAQFVHIKKFAFYPEKMTEAQVAALTE